MTTEQSWALKAIEDEAMRRACAVFNDPERVQQHMHILGLSFQQIIFLRQKWMRENPGVEVPSE